MNLWHTTLILQVVAQTIKSCLNELPGSTRTQIGFITFDSTIHFYNMKVSRYKQMWFKKLLTISFSFSLIFIVSDSCLIISSQLWHNPKWWWSQMWMMYLFLYQMIFLWTSLNREMWWIRFWIVCQPCFKTLWMSNLHLVQLLKLHSWSWYVTFLTLTKRQPYVFFFSVWNAMLFWSGMEIILKDPYRWECTVLVYVHDQVLLIAESTWW